MEEHVETYQREIVAIPGNRYCVINSIIQCMATDFNHHIKQQDVLDLQGATARNSVELGVSFGYYFFCLYLTFGECCESVPSDHTGSYVSISIKHITIILARFVQVDAFIV